MALVDSGYYEQQRRGINDQYAANMAANTYSRTLAQQRGSRDIMGMQRGFQRELPRFTATFGQRGFGGGGIRSGAMQRSMRNYLGDYNRDLNYARDDLTNSLRQFDLSGAQMGAQRTGALADLDLQKAREIAFAAQNIEALKQALGGL
jgi:hypothetical protein